MLLLEISEKWKQWKQFVKTNKDTVMVGKLLTFPLVWFILLLSVRVTPLLYGIMLLVVFVDVVLVLATVYRLETRENKARASMLDEDDAFVVHTDMSFEAQGQNRVMFDSKSILPGDRQIVLYNETRNQLYAFEVSEPMPVADAEKLREGVKITQVTDPDGSVIRAIIQFPEGVMCGEDANDTPIVAPERSKETQEETNADHPFLCIPPPPGRPLQLDEPQVHQVELQVDVAQQLWESAFGKGYHAGLQDGVEEGLEAATDKKP